MPLELTQPWFILLAVLAAPVLAWYFFRGLTDFSHWQRVTSLAARAVVVLLLVAALCGLTWLKPSKDLFVVFAVDDSLSVGDEAKPVAEQFLDQAVAAAGKNKFAFVRFAAEPGPVVNDRRDAGPTGGTGVPPVTHRMGTNPAAAL